MSTEINEKKKCHYHFGHKDKTFPLQMWETYFMWCELPSFAINPFMTEAPII